MHEDVPSSGGERSLVSVKTVGEKSRMGRIAERVGEGRRKRVAEELRRPKREEVVDENEGVDGVYVGGGRKGYERE
jgi:hypothetical protein